MSAYVDLVRPSNKSYAFTYDFLCVLAGSLFLALMAQLSVRLWFTPVPITLQSFAVLMMGALLGSKRGALSVLTYLAQGAIGLPVFAGFNGGIAALIGPTGGYLIGFVLCTYFVGYALEKGGKRSYFLTLLTLTAGTLLVLATGTLWLSFYVGSGNALAMGFYPFLIDGVLKIAAAAALIPTGWKWVKQ